MFRDPIGPEENRWFTHTKLGDPGIKCNRRNRQNSDLLQTMPNFKVVSLGDRKELGGFLRKNRTTDISGQTTLRHAHPPPWGNYPDFGRNKWPNNTNPTTKCEENGILADYQTGGPKDVEGS